MSELQELINSALVDADHLVLMSEKFLAALNKRESARIRCEVAQTAVNVEDRVNAEASVNEYWQGMLSAITGYRKRAHRYRDALRTHPAEALPEAVAWMLLTEDRKRIRHYTDSQENLKATAEAIGKTISDWFPFYRSPNAARVPDGIELAARFIERKISDYTTEHGSYDPDTGAIELSSAGEDYVNTMYELADEIRALSATPPSSAVSGWQPISTAPERETVFVQWDDICNPRPSPYIEIDHLENGVWVKYKKLREERPEANLPEEAPYFEWMRIPESPSFRRS